MSSNQHPEVHGSKILLIVGTLCTLLGLFMYSLRAGLADFFFNAHFLFGIPLTQADALKVLLVVAGSTVTILMGLTILGVGIARFLKYSAEVSQGSTATPIKR